MPENVYIGDRLSALESAAIHVHLERCAKVRNRNVVCGRCAEVCTSGCISVDEGEISIDIARCVGCGTCASVCPTCALEARNPCDSELLAQCRARAINGFGDDGASSSAGADDANSEVFVACSPYLDALAGCVDSSAVSRVVCLGRVEESLIVELRAAGITRIHLLSGDCEKCAQRYGREAVLAAVESASALLEAWGSHVDVNVETSCPEQILGEGVTSSAANEKLEQTFAGGVACPPIHEGDGSVEGAPTPSSESDSQSKLVFRMPHVMPDGTLPHFLPDRREHLLDALSDLGEPQDVNVASRMWGSVVIDSSKCVSCRMCATFCPTGAITKFDEEDGTFGIEHFPGDCVKCASCRDICPGEAIQIVDSVPVSYLLGGEIHRFRMHAREVELDGVHQIKNTVARFIDGDVFER